MKKLVTMSEQELARYEVVGNLLEGRINGTEAAKQTGLSTRQVRRLKAKVKKHGARGLIHGNRGRPSNRRVSEKKIEKMKRIVVKQYPDFGPTFASEKLAENHEIKVSGEKLRGLMIEWGLWKPKPRKTNGEYRFWRERRETYGEMIQFDGSYHKWFEDRGELCCLLAGIDDATGKITRLEFTDWEGVRPAFRFWKGYVEDKGKPISIYLDRHSTYKQSAKKNVLDNPKSLTQFEKAMKELNIDIIHAHSPQAKGRIERLFGTLQDRLIKELRLAKINTTEEANDFADKIFIPRFNEKFGIRAEKKTDLHRDLSKTESERLDNIFSEQETRVVLNDFTVRFKNLWFQLNEKQPTLICRKDRVRVETWLNDSIHLYLREKELSYLALPERPEKVSATKLPALTRVKSPWRPPANHPWRQHTQRQKQKVEV